MAAYHQMGHDSWNLIAAEGLNGFGGLVLSPVNCTPEETALKLSQIGPSRNELDVILDPQLYKPNSDRGKLPEWPHFSDELETVDLSEESWWTERCEYLVSSAKQVGANSVASPAVIPRVFDDAYYESAAVIAENHAALCDANDLRPLFTALIDLAQLGTSGGAERIASYLTRPATSRVYLVLHDGLDLRRQRTDAEALAGACRLIRILEGSGVRVLVAFSGIDLVLWKGAGASDAASGKFLNLRRFVPGRWEEPTEGGRVVPYWTDGVLLTWLRELDLRLLLRARLIDMNDVERNPYSVQILTALESASAQAWVGLAWRQYLKWFLETEKAISSTPAEGLLTLTRADAQWAQVEQSGLLLADRTNNGGWIRSWINAIRLSGT